MSDPFTAANRYDPYQPGDGSCDCGSQNWASRTKTGLIDLSDGSYMALCLNCGWWEVIRGGATGTCSIDSKGRWWADSRGGRRGLPEDFGSWVDEIAPEAQRVAATRLACVVTAGNKPPESAISGPGGAGIADCPETPDSRASEKVPRQVARGSFDRQYVNRRKPRKARARR